MLMMKAQAAKMSKKFTPLFRKRNAPYLFQKRLQIARPSDPPYSIFKKFVTYDEDSKGSIYPYIRG